VVRLSVGEKPEEIRLSIRELDDLYQAFIKMAADLEQQKAHVQKVFSRKLDELAFTGGAIAHEIRNPLSAIEMHFGLLKREIARAGAATGETPAIQEIEQQLGHLRRLLTSFLDYSRKVRPQREKVVLHDFLQRILESRRQVLGDFVFTLEISENLTGFFDPAMLQQVIENLVNNAFQAAAEGGLHLTVRAVTDGSLLRLQVADNGPGVPAAIAEQLFTPFVSGSAGGNGFGLAISRKLVEAHGGEIYHEKNTDSGAVFVIEVPQA
ncbi:MAG TPA: HAMP domain-containing sensor histidine kinase, partial [Candidatus Rifleibacterium sp.]|nr:HAMP domain-containing sensor histidine kinase [Candidatus Rifleibacterium sp.]